MNRIAINNQPFSIVEDQGFIKFLAELNPRYVIPSTKYFYETILQQAYDNYIQNMLYRRSPWIMFMFFFKTM